jgi:hypothetical protein
MYHDPVDKKNPDIAGVVIKVGSEKLMVDDILSFAEDYFGGFDRTGRLIRRLPDVNNVQNENMGCSVSDAQNIGRWGAMLVWWTSCGKKERLKKTHANECIEDAFEGKLPYLVVLPQQQDGRPWKKYADLAYEFLQTWEPTEHNYKTAFDIFAE